MSHGQVHYEVFARRANGGGMGLEFASEDRDAALAAASDMLEGTRFIAVRVTKETRDPETGEFASITIFKDGVQETPKSRAPVEDRGPPCVSPADLYHVHSRDRIGRLLEGWLRHHKATPFELLHRPDLIEKLEASGLELQHAVQKIAVPEAQARGMGVHEVIREFQGLIDRAIEKVMNDRRNKILPSTTPETFADLCERLAGEAERHYLLGAAVAGYIAPAQTWSDKVARLLDLADAAPAKDGLRNLAFQVLETPLGEILQGRVGLADLLGGDLDLGGQLAALTRLVASRAVEALTKADASVGRQLPALSGAAERLAQSLDDARFERVRQAMSRRILTELVSLRRLRPNDASGEIDILRALAACLTAASGPMLPLDEVRNAFIERSQNLVASDFVSAYLANPRPALQEAMDLVWLLENVTGGANKRKAIRWVLSSVTSLRFESEMASGVQTPAVRLGRLAKLYRQLARAAADEAGTEEVLEKIGVIGGRIEAEANLTTLLTRSSAPLGQRIAALANMATGETAPPGPAADRAKAEAMKLMRLPGAREELAKTPAALEQLKGLRLLEDAA